mmetsp:Transcript_28244/g.72313  ORF Transcript_28244/g.72313 Transcript_28244/m.72313 type:complete len:208 (+) Transcript_28244:129-752(+)
MVYHTSLCSNGSPLSAAFCLAPHPLPCSRTLSTSALHSRTAARHQAASRKANANPPGDEDQIMRKTGMPLRRHAQRTRSRRSGARTAERRRYSRGSFDRWLPLGKPARLAGLEPLEVLLRARLGEGSQWHLVPAHAPRQAAGVEEDLLQPTEELEGSVDLLSEARDRLDRDTKGDAAVAGTCQDRAQDLGADRHRLPHGRLLGNLDL